MGIGIAATNFIFMVIIVSYIIAVAKTDTLADSYDYDAEIRSLLERLDIPGPDWRTVVVSSSSTLNAERKVVWEKLVDVEKWPDWAVMHKSVRLLNDSFGVGASFEETIDYGFPWNKKILNQTVVEIKQYERLVVCHEDYSLQECHLWLLYNSSASTTIVSIDVLYGASVVSVKPFYYARWKENAELSLKRLDAAASKHP